MVTHGELICLRAASWSINVLLLKFQWSNFEAFNIYYHTLYYKLCLCSDLMEAIYRSWAFLLCIKHEFLKLLGFFLTEQWKWNSTALCSPVWSFRSCCCSARRADRPHNKKQQTGNTSGSGSPLWPSARCENDHQSLSQSDELQHKETHSLASCCS